MVARAFRDRLGMSELYIADLDAIAGAVPAYDTYRALAQQGITMMVDAGVHDLEVPLGLRNSGVAGIVVGLESVGDRSLVRRLVRELGAPNVWFSLDLKGGNAIVHEGVWPDASPEGIADEVVSMGVNQFIVLDLAHVGEGQGTGTEELCARLLKRHRGLELVAGGGIRNRADLDRLQLIGVSGALVATALHELQIP
jgi:phosphoribosylformimino-5-aminoimidazole carboxamide ribotide isomerase